MNKIYSLVWNRSRHQIEVASELARAQSGAATATGVYDSRKHGRRCALVLGICMALGVAPPLLAQVTVSPGDTVTYANTDGNVTITQSGPVGSTTFNVQLNLSSNLDLNQVQASLLKIGSVQVASTGINAGNLKVTNVADGNVTSSTSTDAVNGSQLYTTNQNLAALQGNALLWNGTAYDAKRGGTEQKIVNIAAGTVSSTSTDAVNGSQLYSVQSAASNKTNSLGNATANIFGGGATYNSSTGSVSAPSYTISTNKGSTVVHSVGDALALMNGIDPSGGGSVAATGIKYFHANSTLADSQANGTNSLAIGPMATVDASSASGVAMGNGAAVNQNSQNTIAIGTGAHSAPVESPVGSGNYTLVSNAVAVGTQAVVSGSNALALGNTASAGTGGVGVGLNASASGDNAVGVGSNATASGNNATAVGNTAQATGGSSVAMGDGAQAMTNATISIGQSAGQGDGTNVAGTYQYLINIGAQAGQNVNGRENIALGLNAGSNVSGDQNIALGTAAGTGITQGGRNNVAIGFNANMNAGNINNAIAIGGSSTALTDSVAVGYSANSTGTGVAIGRQAATTGTGGVALGFNTVAAGNFVALGQNASSTPSDVSGNGYITGAAFNGGAVSVGNATLATPQYRRVVNVEDGAQPYDAVNVRQLQAAQQSVANMVGGGMTVTSNGTYSSFEAIGSNGQPVKDSNGNPVHFQSVSQALGDLASGNLTIANGSGNIVTYNGYGQINNVAAGTLGTDAVNLNQLNSTMQLNRTHYYSVNSSPASESVNYDNSGASGANASAMGPAAQAAGDGSLAVGLNTVTKNTASNAVAVGSSVTADGANSTAIGSDQTYAWDASTVAIGDNANARDVNSIVIGTDAQSNRTNSPSGNVQNSIVVGTSAISSAEEGIAVGLKATVSGTRGMAYGHMALASATDSQASGSNAQATATNAVALGTSANASANDAFALGSNAGAGAGGSYAIGDTAGTAALNSYAIGNGAQTGSNATDSQAIGTTAKTYSNEDIAFGYHAIAGSAANPTGSSNHIAIGASATVTGDHAVAVGTGNTVAQANTFVLGGGVTTTQANSVVLGNASTDRAATTESGNTFNGIKYSYAGRGAPSQGVVSVGGKGSERQVINVAAGNISSSSTDAVNGSQLYATDVALGNAANSATTIFGGGAKLGSNGTISLPAYILPGAVPGTTQTYNNVGSALQGLVTAGLNFTDAGGTNVVHMNLGGTLPIVGATTQAGVTGLALDTSVPTAGTYSAKNVQTFADKTTGQLQVQLAANPNFTSVTTGNTVMNNGGVSVTSGPNQTVSLTNTGLNNGGNKITNVAPGTISSTSTDAVNGSQLYSVQEMANKGWNFTLNGGAAQNIAPGGTIGLQQGSNIALTQSGSVVTVATVANPTFTSVTSTDSSGNSTTQNGTGVTITPAVGGGNPVSLTNTGLNNGGNKITNVAPGTISSTSTDAVNGSQLSNVVGTTTQNQPVVYTEADGMKIAKANDGKWYPANEVNPDGSTMSGATAITDQTNVIASMQSPTGSTTAATKLTNVGAGTLSNTSTDAVNGSQLYATGSSTATALGGGSTYNPATGQVTAPSYNVNGNTYTNVGSAIAAATTHFYSVGSTDSTAANFNNNGATGANALAAGVAASATGVSATAVGAAAQALALKAVAIGYGAVANADTSFALGSGAETFGANEVSVGTFAGLTSASAQAAGTAAYGANNRLGQINIGSNAGKDVAGYNSVYIGGSAGQASTGVGDTAVGLFAGRSSIGDSNTAIGARAGNNVRGDGNVAIGLGAGSYLGIPSPLLKVDNTVSVGTGSRAGENDSVAIGSNSAANGQSSIAQGSGAVAGVFGSPAIANDIAMGTSALATGGNSIAMGNSAQATGASAISIGTGNVVSGANSGAFGDPNSVTGTGSYAFGNDNTVANNNTFVLGNGVTTTQDNSVVLGNASTDRAATAVGSEVLNGTTYNFAGVGSAANGVVSVGAVGKERQLINVASGAISSSSTDAINGSQLYATNQAVGTLNDFAVKYDQNNPANGSPNYNSVTLAGPTSTDGGVTGGTTITNLHQGAVTSTSTDAVNGSQLYGVQQTASKGWDVTTAATGTGVANGTTVSNVAPGATHTITAGNNIITTQNGTDVAIGVNPVMTGLTSVTAGSGTNTTVMNGTGVTINGGANPVSLTNTGLNNGGNKITNVAPGTISSTSTDAVNGSQLSNVASTTTQNQPVVYTQADGTKIAKANDGKWYPANEVNPDGSTTAGATAIGNQSDVIASMQSPTGSTTTATKLSNVAPGTLSSTSTDAVNGSQMYAAGSSTATALGGGSTYNTTTGQVTAPTYTINGNTYNNVGSALAATNTEVQNGTNVASVVKTTASDGHAVYTVNADGASVSAGSSAVAVTKGTPDANNVTDYAVDLSAATKQTLDNAVQYDGSTKTSVTLGGTTSTDGGVTNGTTITNLHQGAVTSTSTDAVNGSQLYAVNQTANKGWNVTTAATGSGQANGTSVANVAPGATHTITAGDNIITTQNGTEVAIGVNPVLTGLTSVTAGSGANTTVMNGTGVTINGGGNPVSLTNTGLDNGGNKITNVAAGSLSSTSTDAVNGSQLYATNQQVSSIVNGTAGPFVSSNTVTSTQPVSSGANSTAGGFGSSATGAASTVLGNQATDNGNANATVLGQGASIAAGTTGSNVALGQGSTVASAAVATPSGAINGTTYNYAGGTPTGVVSVGSAGNERQITHVAAGQVSSTSTDAVNGSQLYATNSAITAVGNTVTNLGNSVAGSLGGGSTYNSSTGAVTTQLSVGGNTYSNVNDALQAVDATAGKGWNVTTAATGSGVANGTSVANVAPGGTHTITASNNIVITQTGTDVAIGVNPVLTGLTSVTTGNSTMSNAGVVVNDGTHSTTYTSTGMTIANGPSVTTGGVNAGGQKVTNVAVGTAPTDAVNVSQLQASQAGAVHYDTNADGSVNYDSVTLNPGGSPAQVHNVAPGTTATDAANVGQLQQGLQNVQNWSKSYTDTAVNNMGRQAFAGVAAAIATASLPQAYQPNQSSAGVGLGNYHGQSGIAVGVSTISESGRWIFKANASTTTQGDTGVGVGAGVVW